jgi:hypothetical protein
MPPFSEIEPLTRLASIGTRGLAFRMSSREAGRGGTVAGGVPGAGGSVPGGWVAAGGWVVPGGVPGVAEGEAGCVEVCGCVGLCGGAITIWNRRMIATDSTMARIRFFWSPMESR